MNELYQKAMTFAIKAHGPQLDRSGFTYVLHPVRVAEQFMLAGKIHLAVLALLHDVVEDTSVTLESIAAEFGDTVANDIDSLTHRKGEETYKQYVKRVTLNPTAVLVKLADINDNLNRRGPVSSGETKRYTDAIEVLKQSIQITYTKCVCCED